MEVETNCFYISIFSKSVITAITRILNCFHMLFLACFSLISSFHLSIEYIHAPVTSEYLISSKSLFLNALYLEVFVKKRKETISL